jgi:hypothetical protein
MLYAQNKLGKEKAPQREKNLIFDFFLQKKIKNQIFLSLPSFFGRKALRIPKIRNPLFGWQN